MRNLKNNHEKNLSKFQHSLNNDENGNDIYKEVRNEIILTANLAHDMVLSQSLEVEKIIQKLGAVYEKAKAAEDREGHLIDLLDHLTREKYKGNDNEHSDEEIYELSEEKSEYIANKEKLEYTERQNKMLQDKLLKIEDRYEKRIRDLENKLKDIENKNNREKHREDMKKYIVEIRKIFDKNFHPDVAGFDAGDQAYKINQERYVKVRRFLKKCESISI